MKFRKFLKRPVLIAAVGAGVTLLSSAVVLSSPATDPITETMIYDDAGRLTRIDYSNGGSIEYAYDAAGNILSVVVTLGNQVFLDSFES